MAAHHPFRVAGIVLTSIGVATACALSTSAGAAGILPPSNPPANIAPSSGDWFTAIDAASATEGVGAMQVNESAVEALPVAEQLFVAINEERIDRGLAPMEYMTAQLNSYALQGVDADTDPSFPTSLTGGAPLTGGGSIWGGGSTSVFEDDYYWMYSDGWGGSAGSTSDASCSSASSSGCWGHRDVILHTFSSCAGGTAPTLSMGAGYATTGYAGGSMAAIMASTCGAPPSDVTLTWSQIATRGIMQQKVIGIAALPSGLGYWAASSDGAVSAFGNAANLGSMAGQSLNSPIVGIAATPDGGGYWLVASDGGIFSFNASFFGSTGALRLNKPIVGMEALDSGKGYRFVASDGGVFCFGLAAFVGSAGGQTLAAPVSSMAPDRATGGYWLAGTSGIVYNFGGAASF